MTDSKYIPPDTYSTFQLGPYQAIALQGPPKLLKDTQYISFTGDFGFRHDYGLPAKDIIEEHIKDEKTLFS